MAVWIMGYPWKRQISQGKSVNKVEDHTHQLSPTTTITRAQQSETGQQRHMNGLIPAGALIGLMMVLVGEKSD